ncbi:MAG: hypothetical protein ACT452_02835 [Microthrixaceae bacterium]
MSKTRKLIVTGAVAAGLTLGAAAIAGASGGTATQTSDDPTVGSTTQTPEAVETDLGASDANEVEAPESTETEAVDVDEAVDGVDHQFEGEEVGNNGDGVPDPNEADEAAETISDANG